MMDDEEDESRDQVTGLGSGLPPRVGARRGHGGSSRSTGARSVGGRSIGGSSTGSRTVRSQSEAGLSEVDYGAGLPGGGMPGGYGATRFGGMVGGLGMGGRLGGSAGGALGADRFRELNSELPPSVWPGGHVRQAWRSGSKDWNRPRELMVDVNRAASSAAAKASTSKGSSGASSSARELKLKNPAALLGSLRELTAHLGQGYGDAGTIHANNRADLLSSLYRLLDGIKGSGAGGSGKSIGFSVGKAVGLSADVGAENKVVRLVYSHLLAAAASDGAVRRRHDCVSHLRFPRRYQNRSQGRSTPSDGVDDSSSGGGGGAEAALSESLCLSEELVTRVLARADMELKHEYLPRRCLGAALLVSFATLSRSVETAGALRDLPAHIDEAVAAKPPDGKKAKSKSALKKFQEQQVLLVHLLAAAREWARHALEKGYATQRTSLADEKRRLAALAMEEAKGTESNNGLVGGEAEDEEGLNGALELYSSSSSSSSSSK